MQDVSRDRSPSISSDGHSIIITIPERKAAEKPIEEPTQEGFYYRDMTREEVINRIAIIIFGKFLLPIILTGGSVALGSYIQSLVNAPVESAWLEYAGDTSFAAICGIGFALSARTWRRAENSNRRKESFLKFFFDDVLGKIASDVNSFVRRDTNSTDSNK